MTYHQRFKTTDERFAEKYSVQPNGCWEWMTTDTYPTFWTGGEHKKASRFIWERTQKVRLASNQHVCHRCDNPRCVNPDHLFIGSHLDNMKDKAAKRRASRLHGSSNGRAKLTENDVYQIRILRSSGKILREISVLYGVSLQTIFSVCRKETWRQS